MKNFLISCLILLSLPFMVLADNNVASMQVQDLAFVEGKQYIKITDKLPKNSFVHELMKKVPKGEVPVWFFFNYGCPVCNHFEPKISKWYNEKKKQKLVAFLDIPVAWDHAGFKEYARAFYIETSLGVLDKGHKKLFLAIHGNGEDIKPQNLTSKEAMRDFFHNELGVAPADFDKEYDSFEVRWKMKQGDEIGKLYKIQSVPSVVVAGKYYVDVQTAGGQDQLVDVVNYLVNKETFTKDEGAIDFNAVKDAKVQ